MFNDTLRIALQQKLPNHIPSPDLEPESEPLLEASDYIGIVRSTAITSLLDEINTPLESKAMTIGIRQEKISLPPNISQEEANFIGESLQKLRTTINSKKIASIEIEIAKIGKGAAAVVLRLSKEAFLGQPTYKESVLNILDLMRSEETATHIYNFALEATRTNHKKVLAEAIGRIGIIDAADVLIQEYLTDPKVYWEASMALFRLRYPKAIVPIAKALGNMVNDRIEEERDKGWQIARSFKVFGEMAVEPLINQYLICEKPSGRKYFTEAIIEIGEAAIPSLVKLLKSPNTSREAALTLGQMRHPEATDCLLEALAQREGSLTFIAEGLGRSRDQRAIEPLLALAHDSNLHPSIIGRALNSLGSFGRQDIVPQIRPFLKSENEQIRMDAALALCLLKDNTGLNMLINIIYYDHGPSFSTAAKHLNRVRTAVFNDLLPSLKLEDDRTDNILRCFMFFSGLTPGILDLVKRLLTSTKTNVRRSAYDVIDRFSNSIEDLYQGKNDPDPKIRIQVERLIAQKFEGRQTGIGVGGNDSGN